MSRITELSQIASVITVNEDNNKNIGIGTTIAQYKLDVSGDINFSGSLYQNGVVFVAGVGGSGGISTDSERLNGELSSYYLNYDNLSNKPTTLSSFSNDVGFVTSSVTVGYATIGYVNNQIDSNRFLTLKTRETAYLINVIGTGITISLRNGIGTATF